MSCPPSLERMLSADEPLSSEEPENDEEFKFVRGLFEKLEIKYDPNKFVRAGYGTPKRIKKLNQKRLERSFSDMRTADKYELLDYVEDLKTNFDLQNVTPSGISTITTAALVGSPLLQILKKRDFALCNAACKETTILSNAKLGEGSFGTVFRVRSKTVGKLYACKMIDVERVVAARKWDKSVWMEMNMTMDLSHPHIVSYYTPGVYPLDWDHRDVIGQPPKTVAIFMDLCGETLFEYMNRRKRPLDPEVVEDMMKQLLDGLAYLHSKKLAHRDLKLDNIMLVQGARTRDRIHLKITDFGEITKHDDEATGNVNTTLFRQRGALAYLPPEKVMNDYREIFQQYLEQHSADATSVGATKHWYAAAGSDDVWRLGLVGFELLLSRRLSEIVREKIHFPTPICTKWTEKYLVDLRTKALSRATPGIRSLLQGHRNVNAMLTFDPSQRVVAKDALERLSKKNSAHKRKWDIFISYRRSKVSAARALKQELSKYGLRVFFDVEGLRAGDFQRQLERVLRDTPVVIVMITPKPAGPPLGPGAKASDIDRSQLSSMEHIKVYDAKGWTDYCRIEMAMAVRMKKLIIPVYDGGQGGGFPGKELSHLRGLADVEAVCDKMAFKWDEHNYEESVGKIKNEIVMYLRRADEAGDDCESTSAPIEIRHDNGEHTRRDAGIVSKIKTLPTASEVTATGDADITSSASKSRETSLSEGVFEKLDTGKDFDFYITYRHKNAADIAANLDHNLGARGYRCWREDDAGLEAMVEGLKNSAAVLLILTDTVLERPYCRFELRVALAWGVPIITIKETYREYPGFVSYADMRRQCPEDLLKPIIENCEWIELHRKAWLVKAMLDELERQWEKRVSSVAVVDSKDAMAKQEEAERLLRDDCRSKSPVSAFSVDNTSTLRGSAKCPLRPSFKGEMMVERFDPSGSAPKMVPLRLATSQFKKLYMAVMSTWRIGSYWKVSDRTLKRRVTVLVSDFVDAYCKSRSIDKSKCEEFVDGLLEEVDDNLSTIHGYSTAEAMTVLLWTSAKTLRMNLGKRMEFCAILNEIILTDGGNAAFEGAVRLVCMIQHFLIASRRSPRFNVLPLGPSAPRGKGWSTKENTVFRGGSLPAKHLAFFKSLEGKDQYYRVAQLYATSFNERTAHMFARRASSLPKVIWIVQIDPVFGCNNANYIDNSLTAVQNECEFLFSTYSAFKVVKVEESADPTNWTTPHKITLYAAPDSRKVSGDVPTAPWC